MTYSFQPIGIIHSCFTDKFGIPRQPGLAPAARGRLELFTPFDDPQALEGLAECSHIWVQFVFHRPPSERWKPRVKAPRLGGNKSLGVFATRSPLRPNAIGLSAIKLDGVTRRDGKSWLELSGLDLLDGTPVLDIKPYVPYTDALAEAENRIAERAPAPIEVAFSPEALAACKTLSDARHADLETLIRQVLRQDPRPQYQQPDPNRRYGMSLMDLEVQWRYEVTGKQYHLRVLSLEPATER